MTRWADKIAKFHYKIRLIISINLNFPTDEFIAEKWKWIFAFSSENWEIPCDQVDNKKY